MPPACLERLSAFEGHVASSPAGRRAREGARCLLDSIHTNRPIPQIWAPPEFPPLTLLLKINEKKITAFPMARQPSAGLRGFPMPSHGPAALPSLAAVRISGASRQPLTAPGSPPCQEVPSRLAKHPANSTLASKEIFKAATELAGTDRALGTPW